MSTAHPPPPSRIGRPTRRPAPGHPARRGGSPRRAGVGWWQPPAPARRRPGTGEAGRVRLAVPDQRDRSDPETGARGRRRARRPVGPLDLLRAWLDPGSPGRPPLTTDDRRARRRRLLRWAFLGGLATLVVVPLLLFVVGYAFFSVPSPDEAVNNQVSLVSYADGSRLARLVPEQGNRIKVPLETIPVPVRNAVLAAEDRTFYSNPGFDLTGILRAAWNQLRGGAGGGSTITQQYVKTTLVGNEPTLWRKYKEMIVAVKLNQEKTKDEILGGYLNAIYFGRGAYGVQSASQAYFGKTVDELSASEGALLAGVIQSPSRWDPAINPDKAVARWEFVLDGMVSQGWLSPAERATAKFPQTVPRKSASHGAPTDSRGHIVTAVREELEELGISDQEFREGLRITTTIDPERQHEAVEAAHRTLAGQPPNLRSAVVGIDPDTGGILAYYGGDNGVGLDYARVHKQAGSTFKPFVVLAALQQDPPIGLGTTFDGAAVPGLRNAEGADCARCDLKQAMTISNNVVFNTLAKQIGPERIAAAARSAGITSSLDNPDERIALGNKEVTPLELASAYATIAAGGVWHQPHLVAEVVTADGRVLFTAPDSGGERRFSQRVARNVTEAMIDVAEHDGLAPSGVRQVAAKTGTVQSRFEGQNNDAWMSGFTTDLAVTVWIGTDMNSPIRTAGGEPISGSTLPGRTWQRFMADAARERPPAPFASYRPIGDPPSNREPGEDPRVTSTPTAAAPTPAPAPTSEPAPPPTPGPEHGAPAGADRSAVPQRPQQAGTPGPAAPGPDPRAARVAPAPTTNAQPTPAPDCSVVPCG